MLPWPVRKLLRRRSVPMDRLRRRDQRCTLQAMQQTEWFSAHTQECGGRGAPLISPSAQFAVHWVAVAPLASTANELYRLWTGFPAACTSVSTLGIILTGLSA